MNIHTRLLVLGEISFTTYNRDMLINVFEMFAGYGGASFALDLSGIDYDIVGYSEIDKYAIQCYEQNHKLATNFGDATKINVESLPDFDLLTGGFPCQSFSVAGKGGGVCDSRGTLFREILRIAKEKKPKYMLLENVKGLTSKKHKDTFNKILYDLDSIGYDVHREVLNSKDYGIPQNRERVWFVCIRKDLEQDFQFPQGLKLEVFLSDILEEEVDHKYFLTDKQMDKLINRDSIVLNGGYVGKLTNNKGIDTAKKDICSYMLTSSGRNCGSNQIIQVNNPKHSNNRVYSIKGISPTLNTMQGGNRQPFVKINNATKMGYIIGNKGDGLSLEYPSSKTRRGRVQKSMSPTLQTSGNKGVITKDMKIRKLTPKECFRLMGFFDDSINVDGLSDTQKYKLAGNGRTIRPASDILRNLIV